MGDVLDELTAQIALLTPVMVPVIGGLIGLVILMVVGDFILNRVRGGIR